MLRRHIAAPRGYKKHGRFYIPSVITRAPTGGGGGTDWGSVSIGDEVEGGIYAGIITYADAREFHIISGKQESEAGSLRWRASNNVTGIDDPYDGYQNTQDSIVAGSGFQAFDHCINYSGGGFEDWYLPAQHEHILVIDNLVAPGHPEFNTSNGPHWTSTEASSSFARVGSYSGNKDYSDGKTNTYLYTRPIRRVPV